MSLSLVTPTQGAPEAALPHFCGKDRPRFFGHSDRGWTLLEMMMVIVILAVLVVLSFSLGSQFQIRASDAGCKANLRTLHAGLSAYLQDNGMVWPQAPAEILDDQSEDSDKEAEWWFTTLKDYDVPKKTWLCPGDNDRAKIVASEDIHVSTYTITQFDEVPNTAYRWKQPWVIEDGDMHGQGRGPNMIFPDGSIAKGLSLTPAER